MSQFVATGFKTHPIPALTAENPLPLGVSDIPLELKRTGALSVRYGAHIFRLQPIRLHQQSNVSLRKLLFSMSFVPRVRQVLEDKVCGR